MVPALDLNLDLIIKLGRFLRRTGTHHLFRLYREAGIISLQFPGRPCVYPQSACQRKTYAPNSVEPDEIHRLGGKCKTNLELRQAPEQRGIPYSANRVCHNQWKAVRPGSHAAWDRSFSKPFRVGSQPIIPNSARHEYLHGMAERKRKTIWNYRPSDPFLTRPLVAILSPSLNLSLTFEVL